MRQRETFFDSSCRRRIVERLSSIAPETPPRWGRMSAPEMIAHLNDQMSHTLGEVPVAPQKGPMRWPGVKYLSIYWVPWPRGRVKGPPEAFVTRPSSWDVDLEVLLGRVEEFARRDLYTAWPDHALFGPMNGKDWGVFCHKHFDHHLRQFGA